MKGKLSLFILSVALSVVCGSYFDESFVATNNDESKENWISRLYNDKMENYNKDARPVLIPSHNTTVFLGLYLNNVDVDDKLQEMHVNAWAIMTWVDEHLSWEPRNYMNIERVHFDEKDIWTPDISVYNSADSEGVVPFAKVPVLADHKGRTYWFPPTHIRVKCDLNLSEWPSDEHECLVRMGSWSHHGEQIDLQIIKHNETADVMMTNFEKNNHWDLLGVKATREVITMEGHDSYVEINFSFKVKRQAKTHATYITQSTFVVIIIILATYALPLNSFFSRLIMHLFALSILIGCYFTLFSSLPANGGPVPFVVRYYSGTMILATISLLSTIILTTRACCDTTPSSNFGKKVVGFMSTTPGFRNVTPSEQAYNPLEAEVFEDAENPPTQTTETQGSTFTASQVRRLINFFLLVLFTVAFFVDYVVLRSVAK